MLDRPDAVGPHIIRSPDDRQTRLPGFGCSKPHLPGVPDAIIETVSYFHGLGEHALLDHASHGSPTRPDPYLFTLNIERIVNDGS